MILFPLGALTDNMIWLFLDSDQGLFDCVDPGEALPVLRYARDKKLTLRSILLTHHHGDHIAGVGQLLEEFPLCKVYGPDDARIPYVHEVVHEDQTISLAPLSFRVLFNPGHTSSHISYYEPTKEWLFCGDTLFSAGCGRVFDGTIEELHASLQRFKTLPPETKLCCGHEYTRQNLRFAASVEPDNAIIQSYAKELNTAATRCSLPSNMGLELDINPFLRTDKASVQAYALKHGALNTESLEIFKTLRAQKNGFK